jgi:hypothetical protein
MKTNLMANLYIYHKVAVDEGMGLVRKGKFI